MEELFAAATGCLNPLVAASYLERAGYDLTRAVNHFLDSPKNDTAASRGHSDYCRSASCGDDNSGPRSFKRQRAAMAGEKQQQQLLKFEHARPSLSDTSCSSVTASVGMPSSSGMAEEIHAKPCDSILGAPVPKTTTAPSAGWEAIAERCQRQGAQYEDGDFLPVPSSLDGRIGRGCSASSRGCTGGGGTETAEGHARCKCGTIARVITVNKAGVNHGRLFYGCITRKCDFFRWADDAPHTRQALSLVWRRFSPPRFKLSSAAPRGAEGVGGSFKPEHVRQGSVGDCWFLAGLAVVSERADLIGRVVGSNGPLADELGCFEVNLFKDGRWESVVVDSWLPCKDPARLKGKEKGLDHLPAFAKAFNNQIWPCIVEKAFAKQHGSYDAISGGHVCDAFEALTGAPTETVMLVIVRNHKAPRDISRQHVQGDNDDSEGNWAQLLSFNQAGFPMGCATAWDPTRGLRDVGLVSTHAYSVLEVRELPPGVRGARQPTIRDWAGLGSAAAAAEQGRRRDGEASGQPLRLVRVRNPWGKREWIGDWGEKSEKWSDSVRAELGWSEKNDGTFWMTWQDFMTRFQLVDVCKARRDWSHASVTNHSIPSPKTCRSFRVRPPPPPMAANTEGQTSSQTTGKNPAATATTTSPTVAATPSPTPTTWAYITVVQPTKRGRKDGYWYKALGLLVTEMNPSLSARGDTGHSDGVLVASSLGGAKRSLSCEVFLESGKAYTASVVCLGGELGDKISSGRPKSSSAASTLLAESTGFWGFRVTVYSARTVQIVPGEQRPASPGYFRAGSSLHQALSRRSSEEILAEGVVGRHAVSVRNPLQSFALGGGAALSVVPMEGSAVFFLLVNASSSEVVLRLTLTSLEGATVSTPDSQASPDGEGMTRSTMCPARSQKIALVLARTADHGSFSHEFYYRVLRPAPTAPATKATATASRQGDAGAKAAGKTSSSIGTGAFAEATAATPSFGGGLFSAQALLPGAEELVRRAGGCMYSFSGKGGATEGRGGSTVTGEDGGVGSAGVVRRS